VQKVVTLKMFKLTDSQFAELSSSSVPYFSICVFQTPCLLT